MADKIFTVDKFLGLNESADGATELKLGEASKIENFTITDGYNLKSRPGVRVLHRFGNGEAWYGRIGERFVVISWHFIAGTRTARIEIKDLTDGKSLCYKDLLLDTSPAIKIFSYSNKLLVHAKGYGTEDSPTVSYVVFSCDENGTITVSEKEEDCFYYPIILTGCAPAGGGKELEQVNILTPCVRVQFSADGTSTLYTLPLDVIRLITVTVDGVTQDISHLAIRPGLAPQYTFATAPPKGENNVEFLCAIDNEAHAQAAEKFLRMRHVEEYNRLFFYGDDTNICYYSEEPAFGDGLYIPAGYELSIGSSESPITGMRRQGSRLLAFKPDSTYSIDYQPVTLADGRGIAGFYIYPVHRSIGNEMDNQVQTVGNYARTLFGGSLYEWRNSTAYHPDERYAKRISEKVSKTLAAADPAKIVTCDDNTTQTYYMFLNDEEGTALVNRYAIDAWTIFKGAAFKNIVFASAIQGEMLFASEKVVCCFDAAMTFDDPVEENGESLPIGYVWESGYMSFGADYKRKYSSNIWISMLPETASQMEITVKTDRRDEYISKIHGLPLFGFANMDFSNFSFLTSSAPKIKRIKIKVKKFVYYKLIFRSQKPGTRATVLGYDQQVRYSSNVK